MVVVVAVIVLVVVVDNVSYERVFISLDLLEYIHTYACMCMDWLQQPCLRSRFV